jgi:hypothetical protein
MGYGQRARGTISISPPITAAELRAHPQFTSLARIEKSDACLVTERVVKETEDGETAVIRASAIGISSPGEPFSRYNVVETIQAIVNAFPDHEYAGHIILAGEDGGCSALIVENGEAKEISPAITWPWDSPPVPGITALQGLIAQWRAYEKTPDNDYSDGVADGLAEAAGGLSGLLPGKP